MNYSSNSNVVWSCTYPVVWCPKYRRAVRTNEIAKRLDQRIWNVCSECAAQIKALEVMPDHVHLLVSVDPQFGIHRLIKRIKGRTSHDLRQEFPQLKSRMPTLWSNSYFVSTTVGAPLAAIKKYVEQQRHQNHGKEPRLQPRQS